MTDFRSLITLIETASVGNLSALSEAEDLLQEKASAPLYHNTTVSGALKILQAGCLTGRTKQKIQGREYMGVSTTRSPHFGTIDYGNEPSTPGQQTGVVTFQIAFVIDQPRARNRFKFIPLDWYALNSTEGKGFTKAAQRSECEEFIVTAKLPLDCTTGIIVFADTLKPGDAEVVSQIADLASQKGIPVKTVGDSQGHDGNRKWNSQMRDAMMPDTRNRPGLSPTQERRPDTR